MRKQLRRWTIMAALLATVPMAAPAQQVEADDVLAPIVPATVPLSAQLDGISRPVVQPLPGRVGPDGQPFQRVQHWTAINARALYLVIRGIGSEGLDPEDYDHTGLAEAIVLGEGDRLDEEASRRFGWLVEDLRDGRTPMEARKQWFVVDPDPDLLPTEGLLADVLARHNIESVVSRLAPTHPDYAVLKQALAETPKEDTARRAMIRANMDRWRWLARDLGQHYLLTNVPEFELRLTVNHKILRTYRTVVGKPGRTATPQLAETIEGVIFNPTWTVPQSIVVGEGLGPKVLANPQWAKAQGYVATKSTGGRITVVQQPGPANSLGLMKLDMPNPHAIFLHDTPSKALFQRDSRAFSHGCIRTERARELAMTLAILHADLSAEEALGISNSGKYTRVGFTSTMPIYITYFTMGRDVNGELRAFPDIYERDAPVLASLDQPRMANRARETSEEVIAIEAPGA